MYETGCCCRSVFATFLSRLFVFVKIAILIAGIIIVFAGAAFCRVQYKRTDDPIEATYWYVRYWGFMIGIYAIFLFFAVVLYTMSNHSVFGFMDYWPAVCMLWTDNSWFGNRHREVALMYEIFLMGFFSILVNVAARIYGDYDWNLESFTPSRFALRHWIEQEIERLQKKHPGFNQSFSTYPRAQQEL